MVGNCGGPSVIVSVFLVGWAARGKMYEGFAMREVIKLY